MPKWWLFLLPGSASSQRDWSSPVSFLLLSYLSVKSVQLLFLSFSVCPSCLQGPGQDVCALLPWRCVVLSPVKLPS